MRSPTRAWNIAPLLLLACTHPTLPPAPPPDPPSELTLEAEHFRRGQTPPAAAVDLDRQEGRIRAAVLRARPALQDCYERILPASPDAAGRVDLTFTVETSGLVSDAQGEASVPALRQTRECALTLLRPMRIEGITHAARVRFSLEYENPVLQVTAPEMLLHPRMRIEPPASVAALVQAGSGNLSDVEAQAVVSTRAQSLLDCYTPLLRPRPNGRRAPPVEGTARYELTIAPDGALADVSQAEIAEAVRGAGDCLGGVLRELRFRSTGRRTVLTVPLAMRPQEAPSPHP